MHKSTATTKTSG